MSMLVILTLFELAGPIIVKQAIDDAIASGRLERLDIYAAEYLAVVIGIFGLRFGQNYLLNRAGQLAMHDLRVALFTHIQRPPLPFSHPTPAALPILPTPTHRP